MYVDQKAALHIVDGATHFSAARFLLNVSTTLVCSALVECCAEEYTGALI